MADAERLTFAYLEAHPGDAARVIERLPVENCAALLARVPARIAAPALAAMLPTAAARAIAALDDQPATALLAMVGPQCAVAVLRHVADPRRGRLIEGLPTAAALASRLLLGYEEDTVGAWTDPDVIALLPETRVEDALERVRNGGAQVEQIYLVGHDQRLAGAVGLATLLRASGASRVAELTPAPSPVISANTPLAGAATHRGWARAAVLAVIDRSERLIGVLRREALARGLARRPAAPRADAEQTVAGALARGYWSAVSGLFTAGLAALPSARPLDGGKDEY